MTAIFAACAPIGCVPRFRGKVHVHVLRQWGKGQRELEFVNMASAVKPIEDALRKSKVVITKRGLKRHGGIGIIEDDSPKLCTTTVGQEKSPDGILRTIITIEGELECRT